MCTLRLRAAPQQPARLPHLCATSRPVGSSSVETPRTLAAGPPLSRRRVRPHVLPCCQVCKTQLEAIDAAITKAKEFKDDHWFMGWDHIVVRTDRTTTAELVANACLRTHHTCGSLATPLLLFP